MVLLEESNHKSPTSKLEVGAEPDTLYRAAKSFTEVKLVATVLTLAMSVPTKLTLAIANPTVLTLAMLFATVSISDVVSCKS